MIVLIIIGFVVLTYVVRWISRFVLRAMFRHPLAQSVLNSNINRLSIMALSVVAGLVLVLSIFLMAGYLRNASQVCAWTCLSPIGTFAAYLVAASVAIEVLFISLPYLRNPNTK